MNQFGNGCRHSTNDCNQSFLHRNKEECEGGGTSFHWIQFCSVYCPTNEHVMTATFVIDQSPSLSSIRHLSLSTNDAHCANNNNDGGPFLQPRSSMVPAPVMLIFDFYPSFHFNNDNSVGCYCAAPLVAWTTMMPILLPSMPLFQHGTVSQHHHDLVTNSSIPTTMMLHKHSTGNTATTTHASQSYGGGTIPTRPGSTMMVWRVLLLLLTVAIFMLCMYCCMNCHSFFTLLLLSLLLVALLLCIVPPPPSSQQQQPKDCLTGHMPVPIIWQPIVPMYYGITVPLFAVWCKIPMFIKTLTWCIHHHRRAQTEMEPYKLHHHHHHHPEHLE